MKRSEIQRKIPMQRTAFKRAEQKPAAGKPKAKKCANRACRAPYVPDPKQPWKNWCSDDCALVIALDKIAKQKAAKERKERAETKAKLEGMQPAKYWKAKAKKAFHAFVRVRDAGKQCASCDTILLRLGRAGGDYDAGHFRSVGSAKHLEFDERNVWGQCKHCNDHMKGNPQEYERRLRIRKGDSFVDELLADQAPRHLKINDYQRIETDYKARLRELQKGSA